MIKIHLNTLLIKVLFLKAIKDAVSQVKFLTKIDLRDKFSQLFLPKTSQDVTSFAAAGSGWDAQH